MGRGWWPEGVGWRRAGFEHEGLVSTQAGLLGAGCMHTSWVSTGKCITSPQATSVGC